MAAETETGFSIDGSLYEMPGLDSFTMDEAQILYDYSGLTIEDFAEDQSDDELGAKLKNPGFFRALMHVTYQRGNPKMSAQKVKTLIGSVNVIDVMRSLIEAGDAEDPPALTTEQEPSSRKSSVVSLESSGDSSKKISAELDALPVPTTTTRSDTSSTLPQTSSVA